MKKSIMVLLAFLAVSASAFAGNLKFSSLLGDNMVLQQNAKARVWGFADGRATVTVSASWLAAPVSVKADAKGKWEVLLETPAGSFEPQTVKAESGSESVTASNVLIGEVWFCSGQSNMEMTLGGGNGTPVEGSLEEIALSRQYKGLRLMTVKKARALEPADDAEGTWLECNPSTCASFSAVGYFFGSRLSKALDVPVGVINASWGGSVIEAWMSKELLKDCPDVNLADASDTKVNDMYKPMIMYNAMFKPASKYTMAGILWFQGESNISIANTEYADRLTAMASQWRSDIGLGDIPFLIVELQPYEYYDGQYGLQDEHGPILREQQFIASQRIPNAGIVGTNDLAYEWERTQIHASQKRQIGERLCFMALNKAYGYSTVQALNPCFKSVKAENGAIIVAFDNARMGFKGVDGEIKGFEIAGKGGYYHPAKAV
ncbi:MAG: sialate O-acetylesterase, partial [Bacteroidia bacterium]|nr:sialate O-acetylesterase [Bacteroidia bacterium]